MQLIIQCLNCKTRGVASRFTIEAKNNTNIGTATVTITGKGNYKGTISKTFKINLKGTYIIATKVNTAFVLDVNGASKANSVNIQLYKKNNSDAQKFIITPIGKYYKIINKASGKAVDIKGGKAVNKQNVQQYKYNGSNAQLWTAKQNADGSITFVSAINSSFVIDLYAGKAVNKQNIQLYKSNGSKAQTWVLSPAA